jgi:hypothetical protein
MRLSFVTLLITVLTIVGCSAPQKDAAFVSPLTSVIATPEAPAVTSKPVSSDLELTLPEPATGMATVGGRLMARYTGRSDYQPVPTTILFLAPVLYSEDGTAAFAGLDQDNDPATNTNESGIFTFENVPEGIYGLVVLAGIQVYLVTDETGSDYLISVEPNKVINLGDVRVDLPAF